MKIAVVALLGFALVAAQRTGATAPRPYTMVLGIAQDGGIPQAGCRKSCCTSGRHQPGAGTDDGAEEARQAG